MSAAGDDRDPEKLVYDTIREQLGGFSERVARYGVLGGMGVDISGSMAVGLEMPDSVLDAIGPFGGTAESIIDAAEFWKTGQEYRAVERLSPVFIGNVLRAIRERKGVTTKNAYPVWSDEGQIYTPTDIETVLRGIGFRSSSLATRSDRTYETEKEVERMHKRKSKIMKRFRAWNLNGGTEKELIDIFDEMMQYEIDVLESGIPASGIDESTIKDQERRVTEPSRSEMTRLQ
jgi:hypothetical protein